jgi:hypothetical protein
MSCLEPDATWQCQCCRNGFVVFEPHQFVAPVVPAIPRSGIRDFFDLGQCPARRNLIISALNEMGLPVLSRGSFSAFPCIQSTGLSAKGFARKLLEAEKVAAYPAARPARPAKAVCAVVLPPPLTASESPLRGWSGSQSESRRDLAKTSPDLRHSRGFKGAGTMENCVGRRLWFSNLKAVDGLAPGNLRRRSFWFDDWLG